MKVLKSYTKNQYHPEANIVERYVAKEAIEFFSEYIENVTPIGLPETRHESTRQGRECCNHGSLAGLSSASICTKQHR